MSLTSPKLLVDGHVHFHTCFTWKAFLDAAAANFAAARRVLQVAADSPGCLMFTESAGANSYRLLLDTPALARSLGWQVERGDDGRSIALSRGACETVVLIAGRQILTAENLEVLALGCGDEFPGRRPVRDVLRAVVDRGALAVIPWGFGKWMGCRGRIVQNLLESERNVPFCLADNGGRARMALRPPLFAGAERRGVLVLAGSDPLPMPSQVTRAGSYGFVLDAWRATSRPVPAINARIEALQHSPRLFGELSSLPAIVRSQLELRWRQRRLGAGRPTAAIV